MITNKHFTTHLLIASVILLCVGGISYAQNQLGTNNLLGKKLNTKSKNRSRRLNRKRIISFKYEDEELIDIINELTARKGTNIILPTGQNAIKNKVTLFIPEKLTIDEAWEITLTLLDLAGYAFVEREDATSEIVKLDKEIKREPLPLYVGMTPDKLPDIDERIRYLTYLTNIGVEEGTMLKVILETLLSSDAFFQTDATTNGLLIVDKARNIKSVMEIIDRLDETTFKEQIEIIRLRHVSSDLVAELFNKQILSGKTAPHRRFGPAAQKKDLGAYFPSDVKIISEPRSNSLIVLGQKQAIERIQSFIFKYIDIELESGKSILHVYHLQYLNAKTFAPVLQQIVNSASATGGTSQSTAKKAEPSQRFFEGVIVKSDFPGAENANYYGGNKLVIAARNQDWKRIKELIEQLDTPRPQVIIEVLIADLSIEDNRLLGTIIRNPDVLPLHNDIDFQSAQASAVILDSNTDPTTLKSDLLREGVTSDDQSIASAFTAGSTVLSFNDKDGKTWGIAQILKLFGSRKVISNPHVVATQNEKADIVISESRLVDDEATSSSGGTTTRRKKWVDAKLNVSITPKISSADQVNLIVQVDIDEFLSASTSSGDRIVRQVITSANVHTGSILALGGLARVDTNNEAGETPILGQIPIIGWLFKRRNQTVNTNNLTVFIRPIIIEPRLRGGVSNYTNDYISLAKQYSTEGELFDTLRDPINHWFFDIGKDETIQQIDAFTSKDEFKANNNMYAQNMPMFNKPKETVAIKEEYKLDKKQRARLKKLARSMDNPFKATTT